MVPSTVIRTRQEPKQPRGINKPDRVQKNKLSKAGGEMKGRRGMFPMALLKTRISHPFHRQLTSLRSQTCSARGRRGPIERAESQTIPCLNPSTDCGLREGDRPAERRAAEGDRPFGGEEGGGREGCCQLLAGALSEPAGAIFQ